VVAIPALVLLGTVSAGNWQAGQQGGKTVVVAVGGGGLLFLDIAAIVCCAGTTGSSPTPSSSSPTGTRHFGLRRNSGLRGRPAHRRGVGRAAMG
jgi:hypothetical protein